MRRWIKPAGTALAVLVMGAVLYLYGGDLRQVDLSNPALWHRLAGTLVLYVMVILIGARGWKIALAAFGESPTPLLAEKHLLISQIGKYLPGNVVHFAGRAAMSVKSGTPARIVGAALLTETAATILAGLLVLTASLALAPDLRSQIETLLPDSTRLIWLVVGVVVFFALLTTAAFFARRTETFRALPPIRVAPVTRVIGLYLLSFILLGVSLGLVAHGIAPQTNVPTGAAIAVFAVAWIAGLLTPGAPGGLGVRESILTLGLSPLIGGPEALAVALLHRGIAVLGDVISFGIGLTLPASPDTSAP